MGTSCAFLSIDGVMTYFKSETVSNGNYVTQLHFRAKCVSLISSQQHADQELLIALRLAFGMPNTKRKRKEKRNKTKGNGGTDVSSPPKYVASNQTSALQVCSVAVDERRRKHHVV